MDYSKLVGWLVFAAGLLLIIWTLLNSYSIFTMQQDVPEFFEQQSQVTQQSSGGDFQAQIEGLIQSQIQGMIPVNTITTVLNLGIWSALAFILIFGGAQIAGLGIKLIKK